jgi:hypothetical protein
VDAASETRGAKGIPPTTVTPEGGLMADLSRTIPPQGLINLANPVVRAVLKSRLHGALDGALLVLHIVGRKTGRRYDIPVGYVDLDESLVAITEHSWRANVRGGADIDVTVRGQRRRMHCLLDEDPTSVAATLERVVERYGPKKAQRFTGLQAADGRPPSIAELEAAVRKYGLCTLTLTRVAAPLPLS